MMQKFPDPSLRQNSPAPQDPCAGACGLQACASLAQATGASGGGAAAEQAPPVGVEPPTTKLAHVTPAIVVGAATHPVNE
jgi:hypothetical protein